MGDFNHEHMQWKSSYPVYNLLYSIVLYSLFQLQYNWPQVCSEVDIYVMRAVKLIYMKIATKFILYISSASRSLLQQTEVTDVSHDQCHVTQAIAGLVGAPGQHLGSV